MNRQDFLPYQDAMQLNKLGFNHQCYAAVFKTGDVAIEGFEGLTEKTESFKLLGAVPTPSISYIARWFREIHHLHYSVGPNNTCIISDLADSYISKMDGFKDVKHYAHTHIVYEDGDNEGEAIEFATYEEAELACIREMMKTLGRRSK